MALKGFRKFVPSVGGEEIAQKGAHQRPSSRPPSHLSRHRVQPTPQKKAGTTKKGDPSNFNQRLQVVSKHFPSSLLLDDFLARTEIALSSYGFHSDNTVACTNICRDASTSILQTKIDTLFNTSINNGSLGGVLTCGCSGLTAGLKGSPNSKGREQYVFFSFPHIGVGSDGSVGSMTHEGREHASPACGILHAALADLQTPRGWEKSARPIGYHDPLDPEFSIVKSRLARRITRERKNVTRMDSVSLTKTAERMILADLEYLIHQSINTNVSDFAIISGVQVHNWDHQNLDAPQLEFIAPTKVYVVQNGKRTDINLSAVPALTPRQLKIISNTRVSPQGGVIVAGTSITTLQHPRRVPKYIVSCPHDMPRSDRFGDLVKHQLVMRQRLRKTHVHVPAPVLRPDDKDLEMHELISQWSVIPATNQIATATQRQAGKLISVP